MTPKIVLFNGPPYSGKDTIATKLCKYHLNGKIMKFAAPLKVIARDFFCDGSQEEFDYWDSPQNKDKPSPVFFGKSCRQVQIAISENFFKPTFGETIFGEILARDIKKYNEQYPNTTFLISDSGFRPEAEVLVKEFGAENVILVNLIREGTSYKNDSRSYINLDDLEVIRLSIDNQNGKLDETITNINNILIPLI